MYRDVLRMAGALALLTLTGLAQAQVSVSDPWVRGTVGGQKASGAFMTVNTQEKLTLVGADSDVTAHTEVHEMRMVGDVMRMRRVEAVPLAPDAPLELKPGGYHIMLLDLDKPLEPGQSVHLKLHFERADGGRLSLPVVAPVLALTASMGSGKQEHQGHGDAHRMHKSN
ncbi:MAG: copper chaperone PCu(A)C [Burkholderiaceae bacterium]